MGITLWQYYVGLVNMANTCNMHWARRVYDRLELSGRLVRHSCSLKATLDAVTASPAEES